MSNFNLNKELHELSKAPGRWPLAGAANDNGEEAGDEPQVAAGVGVQLLRVPPHSSWQ